MPKNVPVKFLPISSRHLDSQEANSMKLGFFGRTARVLLVAFLKVCVFKLSIILKGFKTIHNFSGFCS